MNVCGFYAVILRSRFGFRCGSYALICHTLFRTVEERPERD